MKKFKELFKNINEEAPTNSISTPPGNIAGISDNEPPVSKAAQKKHTKKKEKENGNKESGRKIIGESTDRYMDMGNTIPFSKTEFAGQRVFGVDCDTFSKCRLGHRKWSRWSKYIDETTEIGRDILEFVKRHPNRPIILKNESDGTMIYLRHKKDK